MKSLGLIEDLPRLASIQAEGANPFYSLWVNQDESLKPVVPQTIDSAIKIGNPVSWKKAKRAIEETDGVVEHVTDQDIMDAKAVVDMCGIGCEPASAASVAGAKILMEKGVFDSNDSVVCILTGNLLKDPEATVNYHKGSIEGVNPTFSNMPLVVNPDLVSVKEALDKSRESDV
jgi:threonine synthase